MISNLKNKLTDLAAQTGEQMKQFTEESNLKLKEQFSKLSNFGEDAKEKMLFYTNGLIDLLPLIEQCGYRSKGMAIGIGLPPDVVFHFEKFKDISADEQNAILEANKDREFLNLIVKTLVSADAFQQKLHKTNYRLDVISITMGIPPSVNIELVPKREDELSA